MPAGPAPTMQRSVLTSWSLASSLASDNTAAAPPSWLQACSRTATGARPGGGQREGGVYGQPFRRWTEAADLGQVEQAEHLPRVSPPAHAQPAVGARQDELVEEVGLPAPDGALGHDL